MTQMTGTRYVANSEVHDFKRCRRRWWLGHFRALRPRRESVTGAAPLGNRIHDALAGYYSPAATAIDCREAVLGLWDDEAIELYARFPEEEKELRADTDLGRAMLEGYFDWLAETGVDADWHVIGSEQELDVPFAGYTSPYGREIRLVGKLDVRVQRYSNGARSFVDHKSVQSLGDIPKIADIDEQFLHYSLLDYLSHLAAHEDATFVDGGVFNMLKKVKRTKAAKPPFFARHEVRHTVDELRAYWLRVAGEVADIEQLEARLAAGEDPRYVAYPNPTRDCSWDCRFRAVCPMIDDPKSDAEGFLAEAYEVGDPYARYVTINGRTE